MLKVELERKDIISLLKGCDVTYSVMEKIPKDLGYYIGGFYDKWEWYDFDINVPYTDQQLYELYLMCKKSLSNV